MFTCLNIYYSLRISGDIYGVTSLCVTHRRLFGNVHILGCHRLSDARTHGIIHRNPLFPVLQEKEC